MIHNDIQGQTRAMPTELTFQSTRHRLDFEACSVVRLWKEGEGRNPGETQDFNKGEVWVNVKL